MERPPLAEIGLRLIGRQRGEIHFVQRPLRNDEHEARLSNFTRHGPPDRVAQLLPGPNDPVERNRCSVGGEAFAESAAPLHDQGIYGLSLSQIRETGLRVGPGEDQRDVVRDAVPRARRSNRHPDELDERRIGSQRLAHLTKADRSRAPMFPECSADLGERRIGLVA